MLKTKTKTNDPLDLSRVDEIVAETGRGHESVLPILQAIQKTYRYLPRPALERVCAITDITPASIESVSTFFSQFRHTPMGQHVVSVCDGTACHVKGSVAVHDAVMQTLDIKNGGDTDPDGLFTVRKVACLGCCTLAPAVQIDGVTYGHVRTDTVSHMLRDFLENESKRAQHGSRRHLAEDGTEGEIRIGLGSCCVASGSGKIQQALEDALADIHSGALVKHVGCIGMCHRTPLVEVVLPNRPAKLYARVDAEDIPQIVSRHFSSRNPITRAKTSLIRRLETLYTDSGRNAPERYSIDVRDKPVAAFLGSQHRLATEHCGVLSPTDLDEYIRLDGFTGLAKCLPKPNDVGDVETALSPDGIIEEVMRSGLRGRGGAGFPTGRKWSIVRAAPGDVKYIICNGDEGDPGAFMDRMILESYPYRVIEGMIIASLAVGAHDGLFYIRAEYPLALRRVRESIRNCEDAGLLGDDILGSGHSLHLRIVEGAGAFVCGEETALIASLEGRRGTPSFRPPYPAVHGYHGCPTLLNNTETYALVPWIVRHGSEEFSAMGTEKSKGTKVFSLAGKIRRGGLIEVPMGITINEIVEDIGGGIEGDRTFKAVQVGGPSGGCIPASLGDTRVDYEALAEVGAMMGSGGFVVLDDTDCMVEMTRFFLSFTQLESCGKCTPCRVGTKRMLEMLTRLCNGDGKHGDIDKLEHLARVVKSQSLCGLGKTAPNPVLTTIRYFRDEFEAHIDGRCPAGKCKSLITYSVTDDCIGCTKCAQQCPVGAIKFVPYQKHEIDAERCIRCGGCSKVCPVDAIKVD